MKEKKGTHAERSAGRRLSKPPILLHGAVPFAIRVTSIHRAQCSAHYQRACDAPCAACPPRCLSARRTG